MLLTVVLVVVGVMAGTEAAGTRWALLVAGSNTWWNYRHQADICHAYHIVKNGIPEENIITMMYDDIANAEQNPTKGVIINKPGGEDVYAGVKIDYKGEDVNPTNFLNILQGKKDVMKGIGSGKVIESGPDDLVFVNFADHGGTGLLCFPSSYLYAPDLEAALKSMSSQKKFGKMVMYIEACEAGSMFDSLLPEQSNIFVSTASAPDESSYGWYCDNPLGTCLGDFYSVSWMEHMETLRKYGLESTESLFHQYQVVRTMVNKSHVELYGDFRLGYDSIASYLGSTKKHNYGSFIPMTVQLEGEGVPSRDIPIHVTKKKLERTSSHSERQTLQEHVNFLQSKRDFADKTVSMILETITKKDDALIQEVVEKRYKLSKHVFGCYKNLIDQFNEHCFNTYKNTYLVGHFYKFVNLCSVPWTMEETIIQAMTQICTEVHKNFSDIV